MCRGRHALGVDGILSEGMLQLRAAQEELPERNDFIEALTDHQAQQRLLTDMGRTRMANADLEARRNTEAARRRSASG